MKLKLIAVAALAVCGSSAFAATVVSKCVAPATSSVDLVTACAPEVTMYMAGASAQLPAITTLLTTTDAVFDLTKAIAKVNKTTGGTVNAHTSMTAASVVTLGDLGAKNTEIWVGTGSAKSGSAGKRIAVVYNTANGSFAGVKQMIEAKGTGALEEMSQGLLTAALQTKGTTLSCVRTSPSDWAAGTPPTVPAYSCAGNAFNYLKAAPTGGAKGVQLALADVAPNQASLGVLTAGKWTAAKFPMTVTGMQGFGVMVNDKALQALIKREVAAGRMAADCDGATKVTAQTLTAACQPNVTHADMAALITGKATAALISGDSADTTAIVYHRRVAMSGTQASSNILFGGQAATEGFKATDILAGKKTATGYLTLSDVGTTADSSGNYSLASADGKFTTTAKVSGSAVISGVAAETGKYAFGVGTLEKTWNATKASSGISGASYVKIDGISPNFDAAGANDAKHRVGMVNGYPFQFEMVALKNALNSKTPAVESVVNAIVTGIQDPAYNLAGIAYIGTPAVDATAAEVAKYAKYTRGGLGNNYAPLSVK